MREGKGGTSRRGEYWRWCGFSVLVAAVVQAAFVASTAATTAFRYPLIDAASYHRQALAILAGNVPATPFWQPPLYPYFLAGVYGLFGSDIVVVRAVHAVLAVLACGLVYALARCLALGPRWAFAAATVAALCGPLVFYASQLLPAMPAAVLLLASLRLALWADARPAPWRWGLTGLAIGMATITVPTCLVVGGVAGALALWPARAAAVRPWRRAGHGLALALGLGVVVGGVMVRNRLVGGAWVPLSTNGGINFYVGNNERDDVTLTTQPGLDWERLVRLPWLAGATNVVQTEGWFWRESRGYIAAHPARFGHRLALKFWAFWHGREIPRNVDLDSFRPESAMLRALVWRVPGFYMPGGLLMSLGLLGAALALVRGRAARAAAATVLLFAAGVALFFPATRYRVPVLPLVSCLAVFAVAWAWGRARERAWGRLGAAAAVFAALVGLANRPLAWPTDAVPYAAHLDVGLGAAMDVRGDLAGAEREYRAALQCDPTLADAWFDLGTVCSRHKDLVEAQACFRRAITLRPDHVRARINLAVMLFENGQVDAARRELETAIDLDPLNAEARRNLQVLELRRRK